MSEEQQNVIRHDAGPALVIAGPGCGKSTVLVRRALYLVQERQVDPSKIILLTFSKDTEKNMRSRFDEHKKLSQVAVMTYHAFGLRLILSHYQTFGFDECPVSDPKNSLNFQEKKKVNRIEFKDMIELPAKLSRKSPKQFRALISDYEHVLVDELQDINRDQARILLGLGSSRTQVSLVMVGDPKQIIYGFRGASPSHWQKIEKELDPKRYTLSTTYRLPSSSLPLVNAVGGEVAPEDKPLVSGRCKSGKRPHWQTFETFDQQADFVAAEVRSLLETGGVPNEIVCLSRLKWNLQRLKRALKVRGVPAYEVYRPEVEPNSADALIKLLGIVKKLNLAGAKPTSKTEAGILKENRKKLSKALKQIGLPKGHIKSILENVAKKGLDGIAVGKQDLTIYNRVYHLRSALKTACQQRCPEAAAQYLIDAIRRFIRDDPTFEYQVEAMTEVKVKLRQTPDWMRANISQEDLLPEEVPEEKSIQLCTSHSAKGMEWKHVFVIDCVNGMFPDRRAKKEKEQAEEQRVFYVSITRHSRRLYLLQSPVPHRFYPQNTDHRSRQVSHIFEQESPFIVNHHDHLRVIG